MNERMLAVRCGQQFVQTHDFTIGVDDQTIENRDPCQHASFDFSCEIVKPDFEHFGGADGALFGRFEIILIRGVRV